MEMSDRAIFLKSNNFLRASLILNGDMLKAILANIISLNEENVISSKIFKIF